MNARYQPFNDLVATHYEALKSDIELRGVIVPVVVDEHGQTIDGHQRRRACAELGIDYPTIVYEGLTEDEKVALALALNAFRRHLSGVERAKAITQLAHLGWSSRRIGKAVGVHHSTVLRTLAGGAGAPPESDAGASDDAPRTVVGADGKSYPASRPSPPPGVDQETGEILGSGESPDREAGDGRATGSHSPEPTTSPMGDTGSGNEDAHGSAPHPAPSIDPTLGYRARATAERAKVRNGLMLLDPVRVVETSDDPKAWIDLSCDLRDWLDQLDAAIAGPRLKAVR